MSRYEPFCRQHPQPSPHPNPNIEILLRLRWISLFLLHLENHIMAGISDVNAALDSLGTSLGNQLTAIQTEIQQLVDAGGANGDQLQAIVDRIGTMKAGVDDTIAQLNLDDPAPPVPGAAGSAASVP